MSVMRKVTVPVGRLGKGGLHRVRMGRLLYVATFAGGIPLSSGDVGHQGGGRARGYGVPKFYWRRTDPIHLHGVRLSDSPS